MRHIGRDCTEGRYNAFAYLLHGTLTQMLNLSFNVSPDKKSKTFKSGERAGNEIGPLGPSTCLGMYDLIHFAYVERNGEEHRHVGRLEFSVLLEEAPPEVRATPLPKIGNTPPHLNAQVENMDLPEKVK